MANHPRELPITITCILLLMGLGQGCHSYSQCRHELFQAHFAAAVDAHTTVRFIDKGLTEQMRSDAIARLAFSLSDLQQLMEMADKDDIGSMAPLGRAILKYSEAHKVELSKSKYALEMLKALKALATEPANIKRISDLEEYVIAERKQLPLLER